MITAYFENGRPHVSAHIEIPRLNIRCRLGSSPKAENASEDSIRGPAWPQRKDLGHAPALVVLRTNPREFWACSRYWDTPSCTFTAQPW